MGSEDSRASAQGEGGVAGRRGRAGTFSLYVFIFPRRLQPQEICLDHFTISKVNSPGKDLELWVFFRLLNDYLPFPESFQPVHPRPPTAQKDPSPLSFPHPRPTPCSYLFCSNIVILDRIAEVLRNYSFKKKKQLSESTKIIARVRGMPLSLCDLPRIC